ncbi:MULTISPECIES: MFS transporter small subunit [Nocardiaceae]
MNSTRQHTVMIVAWLWVTVPFVYGLYELILKAKNLFGS